LRRCALIVTTATIDVRESFVGETQILTDSLFEFCTPTETRLRL